MLYILWRKTFKELILYQKCNSTSNKNNILSIIIGLFFFFYSFYNELKIKIETTNSFFASEKDVMTKNIL